MNRHVDLAPATSIELWGGVECTVNRVGDRYFDQIERNAHAACEEDLDLFARLGIKAMRYPVLWERVAPDGMERADWSWTDSRLKRLRELNVRPIVGLVHHGSGPRHTSLIDPTFPDGLAAYARAVAERYPWVESYTPVNEPLTTARFSGLYGHWYPHGRDARTFALALITQCRATVLAMREIRKVNPSAQLVQTDDLGKTFSTRVLRYQADFENERRWLTFDLLCGRVNAQHPMWGYLTWLGVAEADLSWFLDNPCQPDVVGLNYYLTSERYLDENLASYPADTRGGNGRHRYADVEAVRVRPEGIAGAKALLSEAWERYHLPLAVTEAHNGCTREEQMRWLLEVWNDASSLKAEGSDIRAVTAWTLLGAFDWNSLLTRDSGHYEPGVFDIRSPQRRPTASARLLTELAEGRAPGHPTLDVPGWWHRDIRFVHGSPCEDAIALSPPLDLRQTDGSAHTVRPVVITGASGTLGRAFARLCELRGLPYCLLSRGELDIANPASVASALDKYHPWAVVNTAGYVRVDDAEREAARCYRENTEGPAVLAEMCASRDVQLLTFSSDLVFDGEQQHPYVESDTVSPLNVYGWSKANAEERVLRALPSALVVRTSAFFGPWDEYNFLTTTLRTLCSEGVMMAAADSVISPTYIPDLVNASLDLLIDEEHGIWHLANSGAITWADFGLMIANMAGLDAARVECCSTCDLNLAAPRPRYSVLGSERGWIMPSLEDAMGRYMRQCEVKWRVA